MKESVMHKNSQKFILLFAILLLVVSCTRSISAPLPEDIIMEEPTATNTVSPAQTEENPPDEQGTPASTVETPAEDTPVPGETEAATTPISTQPEPTATPMTEITTPTPIPTQSSGEIGQAWNLADIRYGFHDGFMRVVIEMVENRETIPYYVIKEVENATVPHPAGADPSWGESRIDLFISDLYAQNAPIYSQLPIDPGENPVVTRIGQYPTYDDDLLGFSIGLKTPAEFTVYELTQPVRIVIDIYYP
jgi:hypothetical protein